jgi:hypothetical protein
MTTRTMGEWLRAAIVGGSVCLLPAATALAEDGPDHAQAEARRGTESRAPATERTEGPPDHAQAEARGASPDAVPGPDRAGATDHATVESRGATTSNE